MQKSGELIAEILDDDLAVTDSETSIELSFAFLKFKHTVKKKKAWVIPFLHSPIFHSAFYRLYSG